MRVQTMGLLALGLIVLAACGRPANEVQVTQSSDERLSCFQLNSQYQANLDAVGFIRQEDINRESDNLGAVAGVLVMGVGSLLALDDGSANEAELTAMIARNRRLSSLAETKGCDPLLPTMDTVEADIAAAAAARAAERDQGQPGPGANVD
ncbi:MAG: hypothetical protein AAFY02_19435 [Pseudomonadota bacterium]